MAELLDLLRRFLIAQEVSGKRLAVGLSGGADSMVLLDCLSHLREALKIELSAVHVHHGLSANAERWAEFCSSQTETRGIPLQIERVQVRRGKGTSLEAEARKARFKVFTNLDTDFLALGHHLDDQSETLLLQLLRGAGPRGLSSMAAASVLSAKTTLLRPLLDVPQADIVACATEAGLYWIEDESNLDQRFDRNYLRAQVFPVLANRFPGYRRSLARSAKNMADLQVVASDVGRNDLLVISNPRGTSVAGLRALSVARGLNALRCAIEKLGQEMPPRDRMLELLRQVTTAKYGAHVEVNLGELSGRVYRDELRFSPAQRPSGTWSVPWREADRTSLPHELGCISMHRTTGCGLRVDLIEAGLVLRNRRGGERLRVHPKQARKTLTHLFQVAGVPPWERARSPMLCKGDEVLWVPALGYAAEYLATPGQEGFELNWIDSDLESEIK
jgi:tRNA(Ile)-lysidine synthase